ncbi:MAG TPA: aldo/keto reductase, partial [Geminicoccaceae bacterium]|nr:aldo/keto reductase [Geminicoccaceae bacterium]
MDYTTLGRTGLRVSVAGLGCGGFSRLGLATGRSEAEAEALVRAALDLGVNLLDTAASYGTEDVVGRATASWPREKLVIATKANIRHERELLPPGDVLASLERSFRALRTDHLDVFQLHGVPPWAYDHAVGTILPVLRREQEKGRIRHIGITETAAD